MVESGGNYIKSVQVNWKSFLIMIEGELEAVIGQNPIKMRKCLFLAMEQWTVTTSEYNGV